MIRADETLIEGQWTSSRGCALRDANCERIQALVQSYLRRLTNASATADLFQDPADGRIWELSHPGGPPRLRHLSAREAEQHGVAGAEPLS